MGEFFFPPGHFPDGFFADGHFPEEAGPPVGTRITVSLSGGRVLVKYLDDALLIRFDWTDLLPDGVTLASVAHTVTSPLTKTAESTDTVNGTSDLDLGGGTHGVLSLVQIVATLSAGSPITIYWPVRGWNE